MDLNPDVDIQRDRIFNADPDRRAEPGYSDADALQQALNRGGGHCDAHKVAETHDFAHRIERKIGEAETFLSGRFDGEAAQGSFGPQISAP